MKKTLRLLGLVAFLSGPLCLTSQAQTPHISSSCYTDSCYSFHSNVVTTATGTNYTLCKVETNHGDGTKDTQTVYHYNYFTNCSVPGTWLAGWGSEAAHSYAVTGTYTVKKVLIYSGARVDSVSGSASISCSYVGGHIYQDMNANCVYNAGPEPTIPASVLIQVDSNGVHVDTISAYGYWHYPITATSTTTYTFKLVGSMPPGYVAACPSTGLYSYVYNPGVSTTPPLNFGFNCSTPAVFDLQLLWSRAFRGITSGGSSYISLAARNNSCLPTTGTVTLQVSPKYNITTSGISPTPVSVSGHTITWTLSSMVNGPTYWLNVPLTPLSTTNNGDTVCTYAIITPTTGDVNVANNTISVCDSVRSSWDPNHKSVSPDGNIVAGSRLTYTVQFENLGNDTAFNIHIQDTLSANVDPSSLAVISSTHPMSTNLYEAPGGLKVIKFDFPNIKLADKTHPLTNKGSVTFSIKAKTGLSAGTQITNRAGIYFDGNPVVLTNTAFNKIPVPSSVPFVNRASGITVYPNPAHEAFMIRVQQGTWTEASLMNAIGQVVTKMPLTAGENVLNVQQLPAGIYYLQAKGAAGTYTERLEKH